ncbi:extracellular solute-binding protein [Streptomyces daliensis]
MTGLVVVLTAALSACGTGPLKKEVTLKLVAAEHGDRFGNSSKRYWDQLASRYSLKHPGVTVDVDVYAWDEVDEKVASLVRSGNAPDVAQIGGSFAGYARGEKLYSADEVLSTPTQAAFVPSMAQAGTVGRVQYGLPFAANTRALFYNKKLFEKAGIKKPPKTWAELREDAAKLKDAGVKVPYALPLGTEDAEAETLNWMLSGGGGYTDDAGGYTLDSPKNTATFTWLRDELVGKGLTNPDPAGTDRKDAYDAFTRGEVGMLNGHPTLMELALENGIESGIAPLPGKDGPTEATTGVADWLVAFKQRAHREEVRGFLDFVYGEKNVLSFASGYDLLPVTVPASETMRDEAAHKDVWPFLDQLDTAVFYPVGKASWGPTVRELKLTAGEAVADDGSPSKVLSRIQRTATDAEAAAGEP